MNEFDKGDDILTPIFDEAIQALQTYIRFDTSNPPGDVQKAAKWLAEYLSSEGIEAAVEESTVGRHNVVARLKGVGSSPPVLLVHHLDVVPAKSDGWEHDPFGGELINEQIWGRGTLDDKGPGMMSVAALIALKRSEVPLKRDIVLIAVADEETGGENGIKALLEFHPEWKQAEWALMLDGSFALPFKGLDVFPVAVAEKSSVATRIILEGSSRHASLPGPHQPLVTLAEAMHQLVTNRIPAYFTEEVIEMFRRLGKKLGGIQGWLMQKLHWRIVQRMLAPTLSKDPMLNAIIRNTVSWTAMNSGEKYNIIPGRAEAMLDMRILPGTSPEEALRWIRSSLELTAVQIEIMEFKSPSRSQDRNHFLDRYNLAVANGNQNALAVPILAPFASDARHTRPFGIPTYVAVPAYVDKGILDTIHSANERIPVSAIREGIRRLYELLLTTAT